MTCLGIDIGGANLKAADGRGWARSASFALWRQPEQLARAIRALIDSAPAAERMAVTMTGELCDCFRTKAEGARHILAAVEKAGGGRSVAVYLVDGRFVPLDEAQESPHLAAASNWHALARFACRFLPSGQAGLLIDIGSTTTDIVPIFGGEVATKSRTDTERLRAGELVYTGVARTPVCAVVAALPWRGEQVPVAAEFFATTADAYIVLGELAEQPEATWTADGRPLTVDFARERLARMVCADRTTFDAHDARAAARWIRDAQLAQLRAALEAAASRRRKSCDCVVLSGTGEFLGREFVRGALPAAEVVSLAEHLGPQASACAPAHAVAVLAENAA